MRPTLTAEYLASQGLSKTFPRRFWAKVDKHGPVPKHCPELGPCWKWTAGTCRGYGTVMGIKQKLRAHRGAWMIMMGPIPDGLFVLHRCDNPNCVRPAHLFLGTGLDNVRDRDLKGRQKGPRRGEANHNAKLRWADVRTIRELYRLGSVTQKDMAKMFGVTPMVVCHIVHNRQWKESTL